MSRIKIGVVGYGNIGRGVEKAIRNYPDMELAAVLTRRSPDDLVIATPSARKLHVSEATALVGVVDVMILCGGSATDLPIQGPQFAEQFVTVDSYDNHVKIPEYFNTMNDTSKKAGLLSIISVGWDPGLFSMNRVLAQAVLPLGSGCTFWGKGVSQGHSDAIRRIDGVEAATQYTIPIASAVEKARMGLGGQLTPRDKHLRECFVVVNENADKSAVEASVKNMPNYFLEYDTVVHFISMSEFKANHTGMAHGGFVIHSGGTDGSDICADKDNVSVYDGETGAENSDSNRQKIEFSLSLHNNAEFTGSVMVAYARAARRFRQEGRIGALTALDVPVAYLSQKSGDTLRKEML